VNTVVWIPFAASFLVAALSRPAASRLWPLAAVWAIAASSAAVALSTVGALVVLASPLPARLPLVAHAGRWQPDAVADHSPLPWWVSAVALAVLVAVGVRVVRELRGLAQEALVARRVSIAVHGVERDCVIVVDDAVPRAHAVATGVGGRGAIVVTSSMLALLDADEQDAVLAHERHHLRQRHSLLLAAVRLAAACDPVLAGVAGDMRFALERSADEAAAVETSRAVVASALARMALGLLAAQPGPAGLAFQHHRVTDRVAAMLQAPDRRTRPAWALVAVALAAALALAWATHDTERFFEAVRLWSGA
jgi:beta-lactamase regulating signal transducer with metallopeptidase domain